MKRTNKGGVSVPVKRTDSVYDGLEDRGSHVITTPFGSPVKHLERRANAAVYFEKLIETIPEEYKQETKDAMDVRREPLRVVRRQCVGCTDSKPAVVFVPCGHSILCQVCWTKALEMANGRNMICHVCSKLVEQAA